MKEIIEQVTAWPYLQNLPTDYAGFSLKLDHEECGTQYAIFSYRNPQNHRSFAVSYDKATRDYLAMVTVGLTEYYDVAFIVTSLASLEKVLAAKLLPTLQELADPKQYESIFRAKKIIEWPYATELPDEMAGFQLFVSPREPVKIINGSYIIIDYSDFATASNFNICYNIYRDEFFGQYRLDNTPYTTGLFDARELGELSAKLAANLQSTLIDLRRQLTQPQGDQKP